MKTNKFDSVKMMREIRDRLGKRYYHNPELLKKELEAVRNKYNLHESSASYKTIKDSSILYDKIKSNISVVKDKKGKKYSQKK